MTDAQKLQIYEDYFKKIQRNKQAQTRANAEDRQVITLCNLHRAELERKERMPALNV